MTSKPKGHPYTSQTSQASSSVSLQDLRQHKQPQQYDSWESINHQQDHDLPEPVLPWMKSESRNSLGSRSSVDTTSLHIMKRQTPDTTNTKKKQRWTKHKWWLLLSNTLVKRKTLFF
jgi:hypothetical protein